MNILVCIKQVPDTALIKINPETHTLVRAGVPSIVNPYDTYAQELGVRLKEQVGGRVVALSMGPDQAREALRSCLAVGADSAYLLSDRVFGGSDTLATSYILSQAIRAVEAREGVTFDLILCGKQAVDGDTAQVGPEIAEHLGYPQVTYALDLQPEGQELVVKRECEAGYDRIAVRLPAVVTVTKLSFEPRYPTIRTKMAAKRAEISVLTSADFPVDAGRCGLKGSPTKVRRTYTPVREKQGVKLTGLTGQESAQQLAGLLRQAGIL